MTSFKKQEELTRWRSSTTPINTVKQVSKIMVCGLVFITSLCFSQAAHSDSIQVATQDGKQKFTVNSKGAFYLSLKPWGQWIATDNDPKVSYRLQSVGQSSGKTNKPDGDSGWNVEFKNDHDGPIEIAWKFTPKGENDCPDLVNCDLLPSQTDSQFISTTPESTPIITIDTIREIVLQDENPSVLQAVLNAAKTKKLTPEMLKAVWNILRYSSVPGSLAGLYNKNKDSLMEMCKSFQAKDIYGYQAKPDPPSLRSGDILIAYESWEPEKAAIVVVKSYDPETLDLSCTIYFAGTQEIKDTKIPLGFDEEKSLNKEFDPIRAGLLWLRPINKSFLEQLQ